MTTVAGECPEGCGKTLFLGEGGHVTCSFRPCPNPAAADELLRNPTLLRVTEDALRERNAPDGFHFEAVEQDDWRVVTADDPTRHRACRMYGCSRSAVAILYRTAHYESGPRKIPWRYCADHMYGRWIEDGKVLGWRLVKEDAA